MARMIPAVLDPACASPGEQDLYRRLRDDPSAREWIVLHSQDIARHQKQLSGELDFVVIIPTKGVLCLEVKACRRLKRENGNWYYGNNLVPDPRGPFKQVSVGMHSMRSTLLQQRPELSGIMFWSAVIFPYIEFNVRSNEWHEWQVIDKHTYRSSPISSLLEEVLVNAANWVHNSPAGKWFQPTLERPTPKECELIAACLRPNFEFFQTQKTITENLTAELKHYSEEQFIVLDSMENNPRVVFSGLAGTGKTLMALEAARRSTLNGKRVLLLCFNRLLGKWLEQQVVSLPKRFEVRTIHGHMLNIVGGDVEENSPYFWQHELPDKAIEKVLSDTSSDYLFDEIIVDEAQDVLRDDYLDFIDIILKGGLIEGHWKWFGDFENQAIFTPGNTHLETVLRKRGISAPIYNLKVNCRNTPRVASLVNLLGELHPGYKKILRPDNGIEPRIYFFNTPEEQQELMTNILEDLYNEGFRGNNIIILSTKSESPCAKELKIQPWKNRIRTYEEAGHGYIRYCSIHAFKGLEAPIIIVSDIMNIVTSKEKALFYIAATRAQERLIVLSSSNAKSAILRLLVHV